MREIRMFNNAPMRAVLRAPPVASVAAHSHLIGSIQGISSSEAKKQIGLVELKCK